MKIIHRFFLSLIHFVVVTAVLQAQPISEKQVDSIVTLTMKSFNVPGIAVAIVKDDKIMLEKGYGVRSLNTMQPVNAHTCFGIASNSKAFTSTALGILMDEGKLTWDSKVTDIIPEFRLYSPYVSEAFTIRDLLTHRSGLGLGAGDLMIWPDSNNFTREDIIHNLRYLKQVSEFRTKYDYDNLLYIVAGEVIARLSGMSWQDFISKRILAPLNMDETAPNAGLLIDKSNLVDPHAPADGKLLVLRRESNDMFDAAGGMWSNVHDLSAWVRMHMNDGAYGNNKQLVSKKVHNDLWTMQTIIDPTLVSGYNTHFQGYGLGFFMNDIAGRKQVWHTGGLAGLVTQVSMIPEMKLAVIVLTNQQAGAAFNAITRSIMDAYLGVTGYDRVGQLKALVDRNQQRANAITSAIWKEIDNQPSAKAVDIKKFAGTYHDTWFGDVTISLVDGKPRFTSMRSYLLKGDLLYYKANTYIVKWDDRSLDADAYVMFQTDKDGNPSEMTMKAISPLTDFSFDFHDLHFTKLTSN